VVVEENDSRAKVIEYMPGIAANGSVAVGSAVDGTTGWRLV
jgi:hypothetical protein